jgi:hypothetical protein
MADGGMGSRDTSPSDVQEADDASPVDGADDAGLPPDAVSSSDSGGSDGGPSVDGGDAAIAAESGGQDGAGETDASDAGAPIDASPEASDAAGAGDASEAGVTDASPGDGGGPDGARQDAGPVIPYCPQSTNDSVGIYVTPSGVDATGCGASRGSPCLTIAGGIASTSYYTGRNVIFVGAGTYVEKVTPPPGITIMGGWQVSGSTWSFDCTDHPQTDVVIRGPANTNTTVLLDGIGGAVALSTLTIESKATANPGESLYGIFARGATTDVTLTNVAVNVSKGGDGATPSQAASGPSPAASCSAGDGANAAMPGSIGAGGSRGVFSAAGFAPGQGAAGGSGTAGDDGIAAPAPTPVSYSSCTGSACTLSSVSCVGQQGTNGCSGGGGLGGTGGGGGGSSIALFAYDAIVTIVGGSYTSGYGGNGAAGGAGGNGTGGSTGAAGAGTKCTSSTCQAAVLCIPHIPSGDVSAPGGAAGGTGGTGSAGGAGGAGAGGDSYGVITGGAATAALVVTSSPALASGAPGASLGSGASGVAAARASF